MCSFQLFALSSLIKPNRLSLPLKHLPPTRFFPSFFILLRKQKKESVGTVTKILQLLFGFFSHSSDNFPSLKSHTFVLCFVFFVGNLKNSFNASSFYTVVFFTFSFNQHMSPRFLLHFFFSLASSHAVKLYS